jgi:hypothetical protein
MKYTGPERRKAPRPQSRFQALLDIAFTASRKLDAQHSEFWPKLSAHQEYWEMLHNPSVYTYDPADNGPEVGIINEIYAWASADLFDEQGENHAQ